MALRFTTTIKGGSSTENESPDVPISLGRMRAVDSGGLGVSYSLSAGDIENFSIDSRTGALYYLSGFDYEAGDGILSVVVTAHTAEETISHLIAYQARNVNDEPTAWFNTPAGLAINEYNNDGTDDLRASRGAILTTFTAYDADGAGISYWLADHIAGDRGGAGEGTYFLRINSKGVINFYRDVDYEFLANYRNGLQNRGRANFDDIGNLTVIVNARGTAGRGLEGDGAIVVTQLFILTITNVDESVAFTGRLPARATGNEYDTTYAPSLGRFNATDPDGTAVSYSLSGDSEFYSINQATGDLYFISAVDYEIAPRGDGKFSLVVNVHSTTDANDVISTVYVVQLNNVNDEQAIWANNGNPAGTAIDEAHDGRGGINGAKIATFTAADADGAGISYWLIDEVAGDRGGAGEGTFFMTIDSNGVITIRTDRQGDKNHEADYELLANYRQGLIDRGRTRFDDIGNLTVIVNALGTAGGRGRGDGAIVVTQLFILTLNNVNDQETTWETNGNPSGVIIEEGQTGPVATFNPIDPDGDNVGDYSYWVSDLYGKNSNFHIDDNGVLRVLTSLDYELYQAPVVVVPLVVNVLGTAGGVASAMGQIIWLMFLP